MVGGNKKNSKPDGIAFITTSGLKVLSYRRDTRKLDGWTDVSDEDLAKGNIYTSVDIKNHDGVEGEYGYVAHHPDYINKEWGKIFNVLETIQQQQGYARLKYSSEKIILLI